MDAAVSIPVIEAPVAARGRVNQRYEGLRLSLCGLITLLGISVIVGWLAQIDWLKQLAPGFSSMKFNTAVGFVLIGIGIAAAPARGRWLGYAGSAAGILAILLGGLTALEYALGTNLGIDQAVVLDQGILRGSGHPGRMSPLTATAYVALGAAILLLATADRRRHIVIAHALSAYAAFVSVLAAAGYTFGAEALTKLGFYTMIAVHTAAGLVVAAAAALMTRADEGWLEPYVDSPAARQLLIRLLPLSMLMPLGLGLALMLGAGVGLYNAPYAFAVFIPAASGAMVLIALWVASKQRESELVQRRYERHLQLVVGELNHRVKNTLAIVQSLAHQSLRSAASAEHASEAFVGRLSALAEAHNMLTSRNWDDCSIDELMKSAIAPHVGEGKTFGLSGPPVHLPPKACVTLSMTIHELATNATKYGSLSIPDGRVHVRWTVEDGRFRLEWRESDGPGCQAPAREGFGLKMLKRALAAELGGTAEVSFPPEGLRFRLDAPIPVKSVPKDEFGVLAREN